METTQDRMIIVKSAAILVRLEPSLKEAIRQIAKKEGMSPAGVMRMAARAFVESKRMHNPIVRR